MRLWANRAFSGHLPCYTGTSVQVRERLLDPYFHQWLRDTEELLEKLPWALEAPEQSMALLLTFERWLLQLKVRPAISL